MRTDGRWDRTRGESGRRIETETGVYTARLAWGSRGSSPRIGVEAARAAGRHPYPSRTRKLSPPAYGQVLECASLWERSFAASPFIRYFPSPSRGLPPAHSGWRAAPTGGERRCRLDTDPFVSTGASLNR